MNPFSHYDPPPEPQPERFGTQFPSAHRRPEETGESPDAHEYYQHLYHEVLAHHFHRTVSWNWVAGFLILAYVAWQHWKLELSPMLIYGGLALLVHEAGHYVAMVCLGFRDPMVFFLPIFGWLASGRDDFAPAYRRAAVYLMGPLPGMLLAVVLGLIYRNTGAGWAYHAAMWIGLVNLFMAIPVAPFDGSKILHHTLFARNAVLESGFTLACIGLLALAALISGQWVLGLFAGLMAFGLIDTFRLGRIADELRPYVPPAEPEASPELSFDLCRAIGDRVLAVKTTGKDPYNELKPKDAAPLVCDIWRRMIDEPPGCLLTLIYLAGLAFCLLIGPIIVKESLFRESRLIKADDSMPGKRVVEYYNWGKIEGRIGLDDDKHYHGPHTEWVVGDSEHTVYVEGQWEHGFRDGTWTYYDMPPPDPRELPPKIAMKEWKKGELIDVTLFKDGKQGKTEHVNLPKPDAPLGIHPRNSKRDQWREPPRAK